MSISPDYWAYLDPDAVPRMVSATVPGPKSDDAGRVDDRRSACLSQQRHRGARHLEHAAHVYGEHAVPIVERKALKVLRLPGCGRAGVVDEHVEAAEIGFDLFQHRANAGLITYIALQEQRLCAQLARRGCGFGGRGAAGTVVDADIVAGPRQGDDGTAADTARRARDQGFFAFSYSRNLL